MYFLIKRVFIIITLGCLIPGHGVAQNLREISQEELRDKISGNWIGQCVGNYMGFPFEGTYLEDPVPIFVDRYYQFDDDSSLSINRNDLRWYCPNSNL